MSEYRETLSNIAGSLTSEDLKKMVFFCKDVEGMTKRDLEVDSALDLFGKLEERGVLSPDKTTFLGKLLGDIARFDCLEMWEEYRRGLASSKDTKKDNPTSRKRRNDPDPSDPEEYLSNKYLNGVLAPEITEEEQQVLGPELGFSRGQMSAFKVNNQGNLRQQTYCMLTAWRNRQECDEKTQVRSLAEILANVGCVNLKKRILKDHNLH